MRRHPLRWRPTRQVGRGRWRCPASLAAVVRQRCLPVTRRRRRSPRPEMPCSKRRGGCEHDRRCRFFHTGRSRRRRPHRQHQDCYSSHPAESRPPEGWKSRRLGNNRMRRPRRRLEPNCNRRHSLQEGRASWLQEPTRPRCAERAALRAIPCSRFLPGRVPSKPRHTPPVSPIRQSRLRI